MRSLKRYVAEALGNDFEVRLNREEGAFKRPFARVVAAGSPTMMADSQFLGTLTQPYAIYAYPAVGQAPDAAEQGAQDVEELLLDAFMVGVGDGRPLRMPLYNYLGVALNQPGAWLPPDYVRVTNFATQSVADVDDNKLWTVIGSLRVNWRRTLMPTSTGPTLTSVDVETTWDDAGFLFAPRAQWGLAKSRATMSVTTP